jgi:hypothetical protein
MRYNLENPESLFVRLTSSAGGAEGMMAGGANGQSTVTSRSGQKLEGGPFIQEALANALAKGTDQIPWAGDQE